MAQRYSGWWLGALAPALTCGCLGKSESPLDGEQPTALADPDPITAQGTGEPTPSAEPTPMDPSGTQPAAAAAPDPPLPVASAFRLLAIYDHLTSATTLSDAQVGEQMAKLRAQVGENRTHFKVGFAHIYGGTASLERNARLAKANNLSLAVIFALQTHSLNSTIASLAATDLRSYQWRLDGTSWAGQVVSQGGSEQFPARDWKVVTPSRYAKALHAKYLSMAKANAQEVAGIMAKYPDVIVAVNGAIEEELATAGETDDAYLADYSPFAIAEFTDWLRHTGPYDAESGAYAGQGAPTALVGEMEIGGRMRSPFYDDPTPADAHGTGKSFNDTYGRKFTTWQLAYWDLAEFPKPITDANFSPTPSSGPGAIAGGFDAPRKRDAKDPFWRAWSYDIGDQGGAQPPGAPDAPAFGFRQHLVKHFLADLLQAVASGGIPRELIYAHQIPAEMVGAGRGRSGADPVWTARLEMSGTLGSTRFGPYDTALADRYSNNWGIFEWHPAPGAAAASQALYTAATSALNDFYAAHGYVFFPGWWSESPGTGTFPLNDSKFADAMRDWLKAKPDVPRP